MPACFSRHHFLRRTRQQLRLIIHWRRMLLTQNAIVLTVLAPMEHHTLLIRTRLTNTAINAERFSDLRTPSVPSRGVVTSWMFVTAGASVRILHFRAHGNMLSIVQRIHHQDAKVIHPTPTVNVHMMRQVILMIGIANRIVDQDRRMQTTISIQKPDVRHTQQTCQAMANLRIAVSATKPITTAAPTVTGMRCCAIVSTKYTSRAGVASQTTRRVRLMSAVLGIAILISEYACQPTMTAAAMVGLRAVCVMATLIAIAIYFVTWIFIPGLVS